MGDNDLDIVQHPVLGTLKFPKTMPFDQRNAIIGQTLAARQSSTPAASPVTMGPAPEKSFWDKTKDFIGSLPVMPASANPHDSTQPVRLRDLDDSSMLQGTPGNDILFGSKNPSPPSTGVMGALGGAATGVVKTIAGAVTPSNILLAVASGGVSPAAQRVASTYFAGSMAKGSGDALARAYVDYKNNDPSSQVAEDAASGITSGVMAGMAANHARYGEATSQATLDAHAKDIVDAEATRQATLAQVARSKAAQEAARRPMSSTFQMTSTLPTDGTAPVINRPTGNPTAPLPSVAPYRGEVSNGMTQFGTSLPSTPSSGGYDLLAGQKEVPVSTKSATKSSSFDDINAEIARRQNANKPATEAQTQHVASPTEAAQNAAVLVTDSIQGRAEILRRHPELDTSPQIVVPATEQRSVPRTSETSDVMVNKLYSDLRASTDPAEQAQIRAQIAQEKDLAAKDAAFKAEESVKPSTKIIGQKRVVQNPDETHTHTLTFKDEKGVFAGRVEMNTTLEEPGALQVTKSKLEPNLRGQGLGKEMYQQALRYATNAGFNRLYSDFSSVSPEAANVWKSLGAKTVDRGEGTPEAATQYYIDLKKDVPARVPGVSAVRLATGDSMPDVKGPVPPVRKFDARGKEITPKVEATRPTTEDASLSDIQAELARRQAEASKPVPSGTKSPAPSTVEQATKTNSVMIDKAVKKLQSGEAMSPEGIAMMERATGLKLAGKDLATQAHDLANWTQKRDAEAFIAKHIEKQAATLASLTKDVLEKGGAEHLALLQKRVDIEHAKVPNATPDMLLDRSIAAIKAYKSVKGDSEVALMKGLDAASKWNERGAIGARRYSDTEMKALANAHVSDVVSRYEKMTDYELVKKGGVDKVMSTQLDRFLETGKDTTLGSRLQALRQRVAALPERPSNPDDALVAEFSGLGVSKGDMAKQLLRKAQGTTFRDMVQIRSQLADATAAVDKLSVEGSLNLTHRAETGQLNMENPGERATKVTQDLIHQEWDKAQGLKDPDAEKFFIENYMARMWSNVGKAKSLFAGKSLTGPRDYFKTRYHEYMLDGVANGLEPISWNPITINLLRLEQLKKFNAGMEAISGLEKSNLISFIPDDLGERKTMTGRGDIPAGYRGLSGDIAFQRSKLIDDGTPNGKKVSGRYYAPEEIANIFDNHFGPGLQGNILYDTARKVGAAMLQGKLGLSAFHARFVASVAITDSLAEAGQSVVGGRYKQAVAPALQAISGSAPGYQLVFGNKLLEEYRNPGTYPEMTDTVNHMAQANIQPTGRPGYELNNSLSNFATNLKTLSYRKGIDRIPVALKLPFNLAGALLETASKPLMDFAVPRVKLAGQYRMAYNTLERLKDAPPEVIQNEVNKDVDAGDDRYGQVVYDNWFMPRVLKDSLQVAMTSLGWNGGSFKVGLGAKDVGSFVKNPAVRNQIALASARRVAFLIALPLITVYHNSLLQYAMTGEWPRDHKDLMAPRDGTIGLDGKPNRLQVKTYANEFDNLMEPFYQQGMEGGIQNAVATIGHKLSPEMQAAWNIGVKNADYYGREIVHPADNPAQQALSIGKEIGRQFEPISVQNLQEGIRQGQPLTKAALSFVGVTPAPRSLDQTRAEDFFYRASVATMSQGPHTRDSVDRAERARSLEAQLANKAITPEDVVKKFQQGELAPRDFNNILKDKNLPPLERHAGRVDAPTFLEGFKLANPEEKKELLPILYRKWKTVGKDYEPSVAADLSSQFKQFHETYGYGAKSK